MAKNFSDYLIHVLPGTPGCPRGVAIHELVMAARELCERSLIWRERLTDINSVIGQAEYLLAAVSSNADIIMPTWASYDNEDLVAKTEEELDIIDNAWRTADNGTPKYYNMLSEASGTLQLNRKCETAVTGGIKVTAALKPSIAATSGPNFLYDQWMEAITHGAKRRILEIPEKKWSNSKLSIFHGIKFNYYINQAHAQTTKGHTRKRSRVKMRDW